MSEFPRTVVGGVSMPRLLVGTNWFLGYSHTSRARDKFIKDYQTSDNMAEILTIFGEAGVDAIMGPPMPSPLREAIETAEQRTGRPIIRIVTPHFNIRPGGPEEAEPERVFANCKELCTDGRTIFLVAHSHGFNDGLLARIRSLCDAHLNLRLEEMGALLVKVMEVTKVLNAERTTGNSMSFDVEAGMGLKTIPITRAKA